MHDNTGKPVHVSIPRAGFESPIQQSELNRIALIYAVQPV
jgi:hypothetical protein